MRTATALMIVSAAFGGIASAAAADAIYTDNVIIVLDGSGSMHGKMRSGGVTRMDAAKAALHEALAQLPESTHVGMLVFADSVSDPWVCALAAQDRARLAQQIDGLRAGGGTPLGAFMKQGADRLLEQRGKQFGYGTYRLLVVTDGEASDKKLVEKYTPEIVARGITVDVIGVDMRQDHTLATKVHSYRRADDPESLRTAIAEVFAEVSGPTAGDSAGADAFDVIAPLPAEMTTAMLQALAASGNERIGEIPSATAQGRPATAPSQRQVTREHGPHDAPAPSEQRQRRGWGSYLAILVAIVVASMIFRKSKGH